MSPTSAVEPAAPTRSPPWYRRRRYQVALVLLLAFRVALPSILRSQIEKQASAAITGRLTVGDVDLWLLLGGVALKDVTLRTEDAAPADPPLVAFKQLYVRVGYLPFLWHTVRIRDFALDAPVVHFERLASGALPLPGPRPAPVSTSTTTTPPDSKSADTKPGTPWNILVDEAALRNGRLHLRDHVSEPPESAELALDSLGLKHFALHTGADGEPGHASIELKLRDGTVRLDTAITTRDNGYALEATLEIANLPLDRMQTHVPQLGWGACTGRLDAHLTLRAEPGALPATSGTLAVRDLRIEVPGETEPALAWQKLAIDIEEIGIARRRAIVKTVALDGARVIVTPKAPTPLPLLAKRGHPKDDTSGGTPAIEEPPKAEPTPTAEPASPEPAQPWTWKVGTVEITDTQATVVLEPPPLVVQVVKGTVTGLEGTPGSRAQVDLHIQEEKGTLALTGTVGLQPLAARLHANIDALALGPLLAATGAVPVQLPTGTLGADLDIQAEQGPLVVAGKVAIADLAVRTPKGEDFAVGWKRLELGIREVRVSGVLPGTAPATPEPIRVDLEQLHLVAPSVTLTRTADGLVLPTGAPPAAAAPAPPPPTPAAKAVSPTLTLALAHLDLENGQVSILDRSVKPFYHGKLSAMALKANGLRFPENVFDDFTFAATLPGGAPLKVAGKQAKGTIELTADGKGLPLQQFNPYVTQAAGYSISDGRFTVGSKVRWSPKGYDSTTRVEFDKLGVAGAEGDSLFLQKVGIPLTLALSLLTDLSGKIAFDIPVSGDEHGMHVGLGTIVAEAITKAILGAVMSPLKMFGAVFDAATGKGGGLTPEPVPYLPGLTAVVTDAQPRVEQLASGLAGAPALRVTLHGTAGGTDVRGLQEAAVLADLQARGRMLSGIANLASGGARNAIRDALTARAGGGSGELSPEYQKALDDWAGAKPVTDDQLRALATARAEGLRTTLVQGNGIDPTRVTAGAPEVDREHGAPAVKIGLGG